jgi:hypothetical protein
LSNRLDEHFCYIWPFFFIFKKFQMRTIQCLLVLFFAANYFFSCKPAGANPAPEENLDTASTEITPVQRGEYLVGIMGCNDCHSPKIMTDQGPVPDPERLLSGHPANEALPPITDAGMVGPNQWALFNGSLTAAVGPWGTTYAANLTPDDTGLANWTLEQFGKALREGKAKGLDNGRMLLPPMPWQNYRNLSDEDLSAVFAYLQSVKPVSNVAPQPVPPAAQ